MQGAIGAVCGRLSVNPPHDEAQTTFLSGPARSGSTWVGNIIDHRNDYRLLFEPFHRDKVPACRNFGYRS